MEEYGSFGKIRIFKYKMISTYSCNWAFCSDTCRKTIIISQYDDMVSFMTAALENISKWTICGEIHDLTPSRDLLATTFGSFTDSF